ncbi:MAG: NAD(P)/FAD-dependent oxidoreductase [Acidobacteriaceae bacterium]|nr:NAD(P)/FAD-dependent oxidoreductase [Acidobacteriaceae bacterium]
MVASSVADSLGIVGLPEPVRALAQKRWDAVIVGAGHNGLACAAYLARAGKRVLIVEERERIGGACTIEEPWPGVRMSPCAYLAGLLHPLVIEELDLPERGYTWTPAIEGLFIPFEDGTSVQLHEDDERCDAEIARLSPKDVAGWRAMSQLIARTREALRPADGRDAWIGEAPTRDQIEDRLGNDREGIALLFEWSMAELVERYLSDERLQYGYLGQGVIGTNASPFDAGTASIRFHHSSGRLGGLTGAWGYVKGGMGMVSFYLADAAQEAGATIGAGVRVSEIAPGEGVVLEGGERIWAPVVISNADPRITLRLLGNAADREWRRQVEAIPIEGCTLKVNVWLRELPNFRARPGTCQPHHFGQANTPLTKPEWKASYAAARAGRLPERLWTELYFQSVHDASVAPAGTHTMSVFSQYVPYRFAEGAWDEHRERAKQVALDSLARFCSNMPEAVIAAEALGPPDIEKKVGLTGGHIFQGECLPAYMWSNRLHARTPMKGMYLCGACTHPGGSVIAINGRNAAMAVLADAESASI